MNDDDDLNSDSNALDHTNAQWPSQVQQIYTKMGGTRTDFGPQQVGPDGYNEQDTSNPMYHWPEN